MALSKPNQNPLRLLDCPPRLVAADGHAHATVLKQSCDIVAGGVLLVVHR